jgi:hypothetical protein
MAYAPSTVITDALGYEADVGSFGELKVAQTLTRVALAFDYPIDDRALTTSTTGAGTIAAQVDGSLLDVRTNGTGTADARSVGVMRYTPGATSDATFTAAFTGTRTANTEQLIGLFDAEDGIYLGYKGTDFVCGYLNAGTAQTNDTFVTSGSFNGDPAAIASLLANPEKGHRFKVAYAYLGVGNIKLFVVPEGERNWKLLHEFQTDGALTGRTHIGTPIFPMRAVVSATGGEDVGIQSGSWNAETYAQPNDAQDRGYHDNGTRILESGPLVAYRSVATLGGATNKVLARIVRLEFATSSEGLYQYRLVLNPETVTGGTYGPLSYGGATLEVNDGITGVTGGKTIFTKIVAVSSAGTGVSASDVDFDRLGVFFRPNDVIAIVKDELLSGGGDDDNAWSISGVEEF